MALALQGFSIREYAANMRTVDFDKCWPFDGGGGASKSLPQMSVRKFRFWSDELKIEEPMDEEIPSVRATPSKGKQRTPKKRSIVELFAVAPQIEAVDADDGDSVQDKDREIKGKEIMEEGEKKGKVKRGRMKKKKLMMKRKKKKLKVEICAAKKEKANKPTSSAHIFQTLHGSKHKLLSVKNSKSSVENAKKPAYIKNLPKNHKLKLLQSSKTISKKQRESGKGLRVHSILKIPTRHTNKKTRAKTDKQKGHLVNFCCESEKQTTLSGKESTLGHTKSCSPIDIPQLRNLCKIFSDVLAASSALENTRKGDDVPAAADVVQGENTSDINVAGNIEERKNGASSENEQLSESRSDLMPPICTYSSNKSCSDTERATFSISADQHHSMQSYNDVDHVIPGTSTLLASDRHLDDPKILDSIHSEGLSSHSGVQVKETSLSSLQTSDFHSLATPVERCASRSDATGSLSFIRSPNTPHSISCSVMSMEENGREPQPPMDPLIDSCRKITEFYPMHHLSSNDSTGSMCSSVASRLVPRQVPTCKDKCIGEGFVGLPLNSQGELIHLKSGAKFGFSEICERQNVIQDSVRSYPVSNYFEPRTTVDHVKMMKGKFPGAALNQKDKSSWFQDQYFHVSKPAVSASSLNSLQGFERFEVQRNENLSNRDQIFLHDPSQREVSCHGCREDNRTRNYIDRVNLQAEGNMDHVPQTNIQQTMRLMGTNVTVSRNSKACQSYDDGRIWTDKEVVTDSCASARVFDRPFPQQWLPQQWVPHQSYGMKNNLFHSLDASSNLYHMPAIAPKLGFTQFNCQPQWMSRNGTSLTTGNHCLKVDFFNHPLNSQSLLNETSKSIVTSIPGITSVKMGHQIPMVASNIPKACQQTLLNSTHCKHSQGIAYSTTSTIRPPFLYQETSSVQPLPTHTSRNLPQWLLNAKQPKRSQESSCSCYSDPVASHQHGKMTRTDLFPLPSSHPTSTICFPVCTATTSQRGGLSTPSVVQSSFFTPCATSKSGAAVDNFSRSQNMNKGRTNFNFTYLKCSDNAHKTRKRPAGKDDGFMKPAKKPFLGTQENTRASACPRQGEETHGYTLYAKQTTHAKNSEIISEKEGLRTRSLSFSSKVDGGSKSGPIKLSAGAKHILKPSQNMDQDNSRPTHSTIPFSIGNTSSNVLDPQMKAAEIYRF